MHRCLYILEVAEAVCEHIFLLKDGLPSLLAFGLSCHVLLEPALDRMWKTQTNLCPLVRVLPSDSWTYFGKDIVTLTRPLVPEDWQRFETYALRIRDLGYQHMHAPPGHGVRHPVNFSILKAFRTHHPGSALLPRLQRLRVITSYQNFLDLLLVPSLASISVYFGLCWTMRSEHELIAAVLTATEAHCPNLREFLVEGTTTNCEGPPEPVIEHLLPRHQSPTSLLVEEIIRLAAIPRLHRVSFCACDITEVPSPFQMQDIVAFGSLSVLELQVRSFDIATALLELLQTPCLEALSVHVKDIPDPSSLSKLCTALCSVASPAIFHSLKLHGRIHPAASPDEMHAVVRNGAEFVLAPILSLTCLRLLEVYLHIDYQMRDDDVARMEASWPAITVLEIWPILMWVRSSGTTLRATQRLSWPAPYLYYPVVGLAPT